MQHTLADAIRLIRPHIPASLVSPQAQAQIDQLAGGLPFTFQTAFEIRLAAHSPQVDISQIFTRTHGLRETLTAFARRKQQHKVWSKIWAFCEEWSDTASVLHDTISHVWLEYDLPEGGVSDLKPGVFIALPDRTDGVVSGVIDSVTRLIGDERLGQPTALLDRCLRQLPDNAIVHTLGVMFSRQAHGIRLPVHHLRKEQVVPFLREIGWPGDFDTVAALVERYSALTDRIAVDLDIGSQLYPQLGLELHLQHQPDHEPRWVTLLDQLVRDRVCSPEKRDALLSWPGIQTYATDSAHWPEGLLLQAMLRGAGGWALMRGLSHIKLFCQPAHPMSAKAYFGYLIEWVGLPNQPGTIEARGEKDEIET